MKTTITRAQLAEAAQAVKGLVSKDGLSAFSKVRLDASGCLSVTGSNGDVQVEWRTDGEIENTGTVTVPGTAFVSFVGAMPDGVVEIDGEPGKKVKMSGTGVTYRVASGEAADYPVMAGPKDGAATFDVASEVLRAMLRKVRFAACEDRTRGVLCGVNMRLFGNLLEMTATDGRRLAHAECEIARGAAGKPGAIDVTLSNKTVGVLWSLLDGEMSDVLIAADGKSARFVGEKWLLTTKVLEDKYPGWKRVVPETTEHEATIGRGAFLEAMGRAALASGEDNVVKVTVAEGLAKFEARSELSSASMAIADCKTGGAKAEFLCNSRFLKDALEAIDEGSFTLGWNDGGGPLKLTCAVPWVAVVMPYRKEG